MVFFGSQVIQVWGIGEMRIEKKEVKMKDKPACTYAISQLRLTNASSLPLSLTQKDYCIKPLPPSESSALMHFLTIYFAGQQTKTVY